MIGRGEAGVGLVITARHQTSGRGRLDRSWWDLPGRSLLVSIVLPDMEAFPAAVLVSTSARHAVRDMGGRGPDFKWPNDLVYGTGKVGGILSERCAAGDSACMIAGLGLNVSYRSHEIPFDSGLHPTSLFLQEGERDFDLLDLLQALLARIGEALVLPLDTLLNEYLEHLAFLGERVRVSEGCMVPGTSTPPGLEGVLEGVGQEGHLLLRAGGRVLKIASGDITPV
jgi:BirA family biotin operon repressor/biotin-[acetyl-CoA-carboxylase] ligase